MKKYNRTFSPVFYCVLISAWICNVNLTHAQALRFNEISGDSGNNDGTNDGIVELINTAATPVDASCYVVSNGEWVVVLPPHTVLTPGEVYLIACSAGQNLGANPNPIPGSGLACPTCDFPDLPIDFDVCDPVNADWVDWAATGFTIDNQEDTDGDQIVLFQPDGTLVQAVQWGGGATSAFDNTAVQSGPYTLGTPGTGGNGLSSAQLPWALQAGGSCATTTTYVMPPITDAVYENLTGVPNAGGKAINSTVLQGCNSSFLYNATTQLWQKTDHPNPGFANDTSPFQFSFSTATVQCAGAVQPVTVTLEVYNWQAVTPGTINTKGGVGSFVSFDAGATLLPWDTYSRDTITGITTLTYTFTPVSRQTLHLVWDDDKSSPLASTPMGSTSGAAIVSNATPSDCYEVAQVPIAVVQPLTVSDLNITCPTDFPVGIVNIGSLTSGGFENTFTLFDNGVPQRTNATGIFAIPNDWNGPITVSVSDNSGCNAPITVNIDNDCRQAPLCPTNLQYDLCTTAAGNVCPGDTIHLGLTGMQLPNGGTVEWVQVANATGDPYTTGTVVATASVTTTSSAPIPFSARWNFDNAASLAGTVVGITGTADAPTAGMSMAAVRTTTIDCATTPGNLSVSGVNLSNADRDANEYVEFQLSLPPPAAGAL